MDVFVARYTLDGIYNCAFKIGSALNDYGFGLKAKNGEIIVVGSFSGSNVDFDPSTTVLPLSSSGDYDGFIARYNWSLQTPSGNIGGSPICSGNNGQLTFTSTLGTGPFTLTISDGSTSFVINNVQNGVPFNVPSNPLSNTIYTITGISDASPCFGSFIGTGDTALISVNTPSLAADSIEASKLLVCSLSTTTLTAKGGTLGTGASWKWYQGNCIALVLDLELL